MPVPRSRVPLRLPFVLCAALLLLLAGCGVGPLAGMDGSGGTTKAADATGVPGPPGVAGAPGAPAQHRAAAVPATPSPPFVPPREIPGLGPQTRAQIPAGARQAFVVTGESSDSNRSTAVLYTRDDPAVGWRATLAPWPAHNALNGWTAEHWEGDLRSPSASSP